VKVFWVTTENTYTHGTSSLFSLQHQTLLLSPLKIKIITLLLEVPENSPSYIISDVAVLPVKYSKVFVNVL